MISPEYARLNQQLHEANERYGTSGHKWAERIREIAQELDTADILDYGCGKRTLQAALPNFALRHYDPGVPGLGVSPAAADIVVCTDVLEHVEPAYLEQVMDHLQTLTRRRGFFTVATRPAVKHLADGRNAHLIQQPEAWWRPKFESRFDVLEVDPLHGGEFSVLVAPRGGT